MWQCKAEEAVGEPGGRETFCMGVPSWRPKPFPAKRKQCTGHVPSPELQLNPPWEDTPDFRSRKLPTADVQHKGGRGVGCCLSNHVTLF